MRGALRWIWRTIMKKLIILSLAILSLTVPLFTAQAQSMAVKKSRPDDNAPTKADPEAYDLLKNSRISSQNFPENFSGYSAEVIYNENGTVYNGTIDYTPKVELKFEMKGLAAEDYK